MKCMFCNSSAGFMRTYHPECKAKTEDYLSKLETVLNEYNQKKINFYNAKQQLIKLASSNSFYQNYLWNSVGIKSKIRTNEVLLYVETQISIVESKNWKTMKRTGLSYARYPQWEVCSRKIEDMATVAFTDKAVYLLGFDKTYIYPYNKIVNIGFEPNKKNTAYFDVKTTSPYPHRFELWAADGQSISKSQNITLFLSCLNNWQDVAKTLFIPLESQTSKIAICQREFLDQKSGKPFGGLCEVELNDLYADHSFREGVLKISTENEHLEFCIDTHSSEFLEFKRMILPQRMEELGLTAYPDVRAICKLVESNSRSRKSALITIYYAIRMRMLEA